MVPLLSGAVAFTSDSDPKLGAVVSWTVTPNEKFPSASVQLTVVPPSGKRDPEVGSHVSPVSSQETCAPPDSVASTVWSPGRSSARAELNGTSAAAATSAATGGSQRWTFIQCATTYTTRLIKKAPIPATSRSV